MITLTYDTRPVPWSRSVRGDRSKRRLKQDKYIRDLALALKIAAKGETIDGAASVQLRFDYKHNCTNIQISKSYQENLRTKRADLDNLAKMVLEAIQKSGIVIDDAQVAHMEAEKVE